MIPSSASASAGTGAPAAAAPGCTDTTSSTPSPTDLSSPGRPARRDDLPGGPGLAPGAAGLPTSVMTAHSCASHRKSSGGLNDPYGRGKGLSIAAPRNEMPGQTLFPSSDSLVDHGGPLRGPLGVIRGSFNSATPHRTPRTTRIGGGDRG